jgi:hypothetical protein
MLKLPPYYLVEEHHAWHQSDAMNDLASSFDNATGLIKFWICAAAYEDGGASVGIERECAIGIAL